jgi:1-acyl-sn-glycerol-3-phosphate acyltransferase
MTPPAPPSSRFYKACHIVARVGTTLMFDLKSYGIHHVPRTGGVLLVCNHQTYLDPVIAGVHLRRPIGFIAKSELFEKPKFNWLIRSLNAFPVRRGEGDVGAMKEAIRRLKEGNILTMFPEGTRSKDGRIGLIQPGIALLIRKAQVPVVPVVLDGCLKAWPRGEKLFHPAPIRIMYRPPLDVANLKGAAIVELIGQTLNDMLLELRKKP